MCEHGRPKSPVHNNELAEAVTFAQASVFGICVCCFPDGLIASHQHNRRLIALSQPLNRKIIFFKYPLIWPFSSCPQAQFRLGHMTVESALFGCTACSVWSTYR